MRGELLTVLNGEELIKYKMQMNFGRKRKGEDGVDQGWKKGKSS